MGSLADIVIDCRHPASLARFWAGVLDDYEIAPYDDAELARLAENEIGDPEDDPTVLLDSASGPRVWFQKVPEAKTSKNRMHLDIRSDDRPGEVERLEELGAVVLAENPEHHLTVMADPEGNEFCITD